MRRGAAMGLVFSVILTLASPAVAHGATTTPSAPAILTSFDPDGEPCTGVPNSVPGVFDFTAACANHDACYAAGSDRQACDVAFREEMITACDTQHPEVYDPRRYTCLSFAELYYIGVRIFGGFFFPTS